MRYDEPKIYIEIKTKYVNEIVKNLKEVSTYTTHNKRVLIEYLIQNISEQKYEYEISLKSKILKNKKILETLK